MEDDEEAADFAETFDALQTIDSIEWCEETVGLDGDDGRWDKSNYTPDALQAVLEEIAECNDCSVEEVTDEMFNEHVTPEEDDVISSSTYSYIKKTGKSISIYETIMESVKKETNEK